jgi:DNA-binding MarR family transcriptional regulator
MFAHANTCPQGDNAVAGLHFPVMAEANVLETAEGLKYFAPQRGLAWLGLLQAHAELTRSLDAELQAEHGVSLSAYEMLSRLALCPEGFMRMSDLASATGLSLSRVSRLVDQLEQRALVSRRSCESDSRIVYAAIDPDGRDLVRRAQDTFFSVVDERFFGRLSCAEVEQLGSLLERLGGQRGDSCGSG